MSQEEKEQRDFKTLLESIRLAWIELDVPNPEDKQRGRKSFLKMLPAP